MGALTATNRGSLGNTFDILSGAMDIVTFLEETISETREPISPRGCEGLSRVLMYVNQELQQAANLIDQELISEGEIDA